MIHNPSGMKNHPVVSHDAWLSARKALLAKEKELTRMRDELSQQRRALPWERVDKPYLFEGPDGKLTLSDLFEHRSQLIVYHFMFAPEWEEGCESCSFWADSFNGSVVHLKQRDVSFVAISRAPVAKIEAFKKRMGWSFPRIAQREVVCSEQALHVPRRCPSLSCQACDVVSCHLYSRRWGRDWGFSSEKPFLVLSQHRENSVRLVFVSTSRGGDLCLFCSNQTPMHPSMPSLRT